MKVGFIGVGLLGQPCAETMARVHDVTGFDRRHRTPLFPMADSLEELVADKEFVFVAVQTQHTASYDGTHPVYDLPREDFDYTHVREVLQQIDAVAQPGQVVVLISTVLPGTIRRDMKPLLQNIKIIYNPYFIAMVTVIEDFLKPSLMVYGTDAGDPDDPDVQKLQQFYRECTDEVSPNTASGTWEEIEAVKIFYNTFITWKITFANMIAECGERLGHMNVDKVTQVLANEHKRIISPMYLTAGGGDAGPCHPRDNIALSWMSENLGLGYDLFGTLIQARETQAFRLATRALSYGMPVVLMGKSYKPNTNLTMGSYSLLVGNIIDELGVRPYFYDKLIECGDIPAPHEAKTFVLMHKDSFYHNYPFPAGSVIIDLWRECPPVRQCAVKYFGAPNA